MSYRLLLLILIAAVIAVFLLIRAMHRLKPRTQFMVLLVMGVSIGFIFLIMVQMPKFPQWLGITLVLVVFIASLFGTRIFLRSVAQDEKREDEEIRREDVRNLTDPGFPNTNPTKRIS